METRETRGPKEIGLGGLEHFSFGDYSGLFWRRKWEILLTCLSIASATALLVLLLPNVYRATTVILVDPQKISDTLVPSTLTSGVADRLPTLRQQVLSATRLSKIVLEMNLYGDERKNKTQDEIVEMMRKSIEIDVAAAASGGGLGAFSISYSSGNRQQAAEVTNRLASLFIQENVKARDDQVLGTSEFLENELVDARRDLEAKEEKIRELKTRYASELPESQTMHVQALSSLQLELRAEMDGSSRANQQKMYLQSLLTDSSPVVNLDQQGASSAELIPLKTQLIQAQTQLDQLRKRYGPQHPDVIKKGLEVAAIERQIEELQKDSGAQSVPATAKAAPTKRQNPVLESQIAALDEEIRKHADREAEVRKEMAFHQSKLEQIPVLEQQVVAINRDYEIARDHYKILLDRKFSADISSNMETRQKGERFVILDSARVPEHPLKPNRPLINLLGLAGGLAAGIVLALMMEVLGGTVKTEKELAELVPVPVFGEIPLLPTRRQSQRQLRRTILAACSSTVLALAYASLFFVTWQ